MSSEVEIGSLAALYGWGKDASFEGEPVGSTPTPEGDDRVLTTAGDRPSNDSLPALADPTADFGDPQLVARRKDVETKHARIIAFLERYKYDGILLRRADNIAWFTAGGELSRCLSSEWGAVAIYVGRNCRVVMTDNVQNARVFEEELAGLGFQLKERPWHHDNVAFLTRLLQNKRVATDDGFGNHPCELLRLRNLRWPMTPLERQWLRELGRTLTLSVEATCRNFMPGETEADVAGHLAHRLIREGVIPVDLRVAGEHRLARFRQPNFKAVAIDRRATISAVGRRHGLCASVTRTVSFGRVDQNCRDQHCLAAMVDATCIFFSRPGRTLGEVFQRARRIYEKFNHPDEWLLDYQGFQIGYNPRELMFVPESDFVIPSDSAVCWSPSVGSARSEDTVVVDQRGFEVVTEAQIWPKLEVTVKGYAIPRPGILER
jgi:Xaa-Pro aminopeptidase